MRVISLYAVLAFAALTVAACSSDTTSESGAFVDPAVWEALEEQADVEVYIALRKLDIPLAEQDGEMRMAHAGSVQASVYSALSSEDFDTTRQFRYTAALTGRITKNGVALAAALSDVLGIIVPGQGTRDLETVTQETGVATGTLTGTISFLVEQIIVDGAIVEEILEPVTNGQVAIPELGVVQNLAMDGSYNFVQLSLAQYPMLVSVEVQAEGFRPTIWANRLVLHPDSRPNFTPRIELGEEPKRTDSCPDLLAAPEMSLSAARHQHAQLCAEKAALVGPGVYQAFEENEWAEVFVSLIQTGRADPTTRQQSVLSAMTEADFVLLNDFGGAFALHARLTRLGLEQIRMHPDVAAVALNEFELDDEMLLP